ncbi:MAG: holo-ACP synthase [Candidatus Obscuribacterales bacterium]|nr:holo-ACP synthase [Candidatus Obscuribacterales bacterium]
MAELESGLNFKIGTDICSIARIEKVYNRFGDKFFKKILTEDETVYVLSARHHMLSRLAVRFAAKEATVKALGTGFRSISFKEVEVCRKASGEPSIKLHGRALERAAKLGLTRFEVSLSHETDYAVAFVIAYGQSL